MKAIPRQPKPAILAFNFEGDRLTTLQTICDDLGAGLINYCASETPEAFSLTIGDLLDGGSVAAKTELSAEAKLAMSALAFPEEMFLLANLPEQTLDAFLTATREKDLWIPLKAVATPTNAGWRPMALKMELMEEHAAMQAAIAEICSFPSIPVNVTMNEFIEIAKNYSTPKSGTFINGILDTIVKELKAENKLTKATYVNSYKK